MMTAYPEHWASDVDLIERYLLRRLPDGEVEVLRTHLDTCESCRTAVLHQAHLIAGIRRAGRDALKSRLRTRLARQRGPVVWSQLASLAAALVVVTCGLLVFRFWPGESFNRTERSREISLAPDSSLHPQPLWIIGHVTTLPVPKREKRDHDNLAQTTMGHVQGFPVTVGSATCTLRVAFAQAVRPADSGEKRMRGATTIPTLLERRGDEITLTIPADPVLLGTDVVSVTSGGDTLVVRTRIAEIVYRLPS